jgi:RNA polymerase sigma-70 factor (ECF subfamily)
VDSDSPDQTFAAPDAERETVAAYHEYGSTLLRYAVQLAGGHDLAQDAVQEVFLRYFTERRYGRPIENPRAWLYQVLRNYVLDRFKAAPAQREIPTDLDNLADERRYDPEEAIERTQAARQLESALTPREFDCLVLRGEGFSYAEIAATMKIRPGTVGALLTRVQHKLRRATGLDGSGGLGCAARALLSLTQRRMAPVDY